MFGADLVGEGEVREAWSRAVKAVHEGAERGVIQGVLRGVNEAKTKHRFQNRTGALEAIITDEIRGWTGDEYVGSITARKAYASYVEEGTRKTRSLPFMSLAYLKAEATLQREVELGIERAQAILR